MRSMSTPLWGHWARSAPRNMDDIFFAPISACQAPKGGLTLLGPVRRVFTPLAGIIPTTARTFMGNMAISLEPVAPGNLGMLLDAAIHSHDPHLFQVKQTQSIHLCQPDQCSHHPAETGKSLHGSSRSGFLNVLFFFSDCLLGVSPRDADLGLRKISIFTPLPIRHL